MNALLVALSLPYLRTHALRILLTLLGVIIGVQGMVAMSALSGTIVRSFESGVDAVAGNATLQVAGPESGIPESLVAETQAVPGVDSASALIQGSLSTVADGHEQVAVFGVDLLGELGARSPQFPRRHVHIEDELMFLNSSDSIALGQPLLERHGLAVGSKVELVTPAGRRNFTVRGTLDPVGPAKLFAGAVALVDLAAAQKLFLAPGLVQTIYVSVQPGQSVDAVASRLRTVIGARARVERTAVRGEQVEGILGSLRVALSLASLVTMIVAFFIIYQTVAISVEQRRREIAIARSLGFTRRAVAAVFLTESLLLGVLGAAGGIAGGYLLARLSLETVAAGISDMYVRVAPSEVVLPVAGTSIAALLGLATCLMAGLVPALRAARELPADVLRSTAGVQAEAPRRLPAALGLTTIAAAMVFLGIDPRIDAAAWKTAWIMLGHTLIILGFALLSPFFVWKLGGVLAALGARAPLPAGLAIEFFSRKPRRAAATVSAIMVGYALVVVLGSVVHSIERTMSDWLAHLFASDLMVGMSSPGLSSGSFDSALTAELARVPGVQSVERHRKGLFSHDGHAVVLVAFDRRNRPDKSPLEIVSSRPGAYAAAEAGDAVFVSDSFAFRYGYGLGDTLTLDTAVGRRRFEIGGITRDYAMDLGTILVDIDVYQRLWKDTRLTNANLWQSPGTDLGELRARVTQLIASDPRISVVTNSEFKAEVDARVHNLLRVLGSLQVFACAIAILGVTNFLLAAILDRRREISLLRSVGVTRTQIRRAIVIEAALIGLAGAGLGSVAGFPAAFYMVTHSLRVSSGWSLDFSFPTALAASTVLAITAAAAAAGYLPARRITSGTVLAGLKTE